MKAPIALLLGLSAPLAFAQTTPADLAALLAHPIIEPTLPLAEVRAFTTARVPALPAITTLAEWKKYADRTRTDVLENIVFRDDTARAWRDAKTRVEWLDTIPGGPGYSIRKLRYEALPGLWIPALLYQPENISGKIPVHLAVNGHDKDGKAAPSCVRRD